jgi:hypothetical protein
MIIGLQCSSTQKVVGLPNKMAECFLFIAHVPMCRVEHFSVLFGGQSLTTSTSHRLLSQKMLCIAE